MTKLFNRQLEIVLRNNTERVIYKNPLRINVSGEVSINNEKNSLTVLVYNTKFNRVYKELRVSAGYINSQLSTILIGDISKASSNVETVDTINMYEVITGKLQLQNYHLTKYNATRIEVLRDFSSRLGLPLNTNDVAHSFLNKTVKLGYNGTTEQVLNALLDNTGYLWTIDTELKIIKDDVLISTNGNIPFINSTSGLIKTIEVDDSIAKFTTLFNYGIKLGEYVKIQDKYNKLTGKVIAITYDLDNYEGNFTQTVKIGVNSNGV